MRATYAVVWREGHDPAASGRLEVRPRTIAFTGASHGRAVERVVPLETVRAIRVGPSAGDRLDGRCSLVLELGHGSSIRVASVAQPGIVAELAERVAGLCLGRDETRADDTDDPSLFFAPTPGPGDSEGGAIYSP